MFRIPDRVADLFGDQRILGEFEQALKAADCFHPGQRMYLDGGPFSGAVQVVYQTLEDVDLAKAPEADRRMVAGVRTLARQLKLSGYAMAQVRDAEEKARGDWPELLAFARAALNSWETGAGHDGPTLCAQWIVDPCEYFLSSGSPGEDRDDSYAALRQLATHFSGYAGFRQEWTLRVK
ncbi:hypothetical protein ACGFZC_00885 [[Kitasatospora] papulosa]|jgi:hypothetical protein|uniref:hypothetical protein n=1 Tax=[Kitasatospora] papulosa TaxID=1464011 RepID=UPI00371070ED